jgi:hypothetical protein
MPIKPELPVLLISERAPRWRRAFLTLVS